MHQHAHAITSALRFIYYMLSSKLLNEAICMVNSQYSIKIMYFIFLQFGMKMCHFTWAFGGTAGGALMLKQN